MTERDFLDIAVKTLWICILVASPALLSTLITGILVSVLQAATQINEQTLSFIPKIVVMTLAVAISGPWILQTLIQFTIEIMQKIPGLTHGH